MLKKLFCVLVFMFAATVLEDETMNECLYCNDCPALDEIDIYV